jgi:hypothetical protein
MFQNLQKPFADKESALKLLNILFLNTLFLGIFTLILTIVSFFLKDNSTIIKLSEVFEIQAFYIFATSAFVYLATAILFCKMRLKAVGVVFMILNILNLITLSPLSIMVSFIFSYYTFRAFKAIDYLNKYENKQE